MKWLQQGHRYLDADYDGVPCESLSSYSVSPTCGACPPMPMPFRGSCQRTQQGAGRCWQQPVERH